MQPEDIIQQKEWTALTDAERTAVAPLAATETEYNLLKQLLQVSTADDVPQLTETLLPTLKEHLPVRAQERLWVWYAAAAVLFAVIAGSLFISTPKNDNQFVRSNSPAATPKTNDTTLRPPALVPIQPSTNDVASVQPTAKSLKNERNKPDRSLAVNTTAVKTLVSANASLLDFVTEVY